MQVVIIIKKCLFIFFIACLSLSTLFGIKIVKATKVANTSFKVCIDPGHGGFDGGTKYDDILEKDIVLNFSKLLATNLRASGYTVILTRSKDEATGENKTQDMHKRLEIINNSKADIYISIHANSFPSKLVHGAQVFYNEKFEKNKNISEIFMRNIKMVDKLNQREIHTIKDKFITDNALIPGCLIELGFLSNEYDLNNLQNEMYLVDLAMALYLGIVEYFDYLK